ncbi:rho GTPase-activating protein 20-like [Dipodomys spectabilis]|uniref:rho GTPase-activating protein 20-like n=1 Tax=Dipodomys spectabilis TaxID=105255 RepID=UPI001C545FE6|nr:rho GTPase-activating protein 20-like [Dipodomys spectabilis]XP_042548924.1 rho GTPase-activating protein 20-like [Dipodomys spectabilis]
MNHKGSESDYQLWLHSEHEEAPFVFIESEQKKEGRGRSFIIWFFGWRSSTAKENKPLKSSRVKTRLLFGTSLEAACKDGKLPSPILEMISFLSQEGRLTEGIFRKSSSVKAFRALKEKLMSGARVDLHQESVSVVASVLKSFRNAAQSQPTAAETSLWNVKPNPPDFLHKPDDLLQPSCVHSFQLDGPAS